MPRQAPVHGRRRLTTKRHSTQRQDRERGNSGQRGYDARWQKLRSSKWRANPLCEHCEARGRVVPADDIDHIEPIDQRPDLRLVWGNLQSLCRRCHNRKTAKQRTSA